MLLKGCQPLAHLWQARGYIKNLELNHQSQAYKFPNSAKDNAVCFCNEENFVQFVRFALN